MNTNPGPLAAETFRVTKIGRHAPFARGPVNWIDTNVNTVAQISRGGASGVFQPLWRLCFSEQPTLNSRNGIM